ncbi:MAG: DUF4258 domain-containing protein [Chloroflexota bacterium]
MPDEATASSFVKIVRAAAHKLILFLPHAIDRMNSPEKLITTDEVRAAIFDGEIIEDYPEDARGHSCLMLGYSTDDARPIHVVCSPKDKYLAIITVYLPDVRQWSQDFRKRLEDAKQ